MNEVNILLPSVGKKTSLVCAFRNALAGNGAVCATDINKDAAGLKVADFEEVVPRRDDPDFLDVIEQIIKTRNITALVPTSELDLAFFSQNKERVSCRVICADNDTIDVCRNKRKFTDFCNENGFLTPPFTPGTQATYFAKPVMGAGSKGCKIISESEIEQYRADFVIQNFMKLPEYSVDVYCSINEPGRVIGVVVRERIIIVNGETYVGETVRNLDIEAQARSMAKDLKMIGQNTLQCFYEESTRKVYWIEANARFGGGTPLAIEAGLKSPEYIVAELRGQRVSSVETSASVRMYRSDKDIFRHQLPTTAKKVYVVDLDGTLCSEGVPYEQARPILKTIARINALYDDGHQVVIHTARGCKSGVDWRELTTQQLTQWGVKYHELRFGKPYGDFYIDNKAINSLEL